jgi:hypothetical protein
MGSPILQVGCTIQCPHGGMCSPVTTNTTVKVGGSLALLVADTFPIAGCTFSPGPVPHPCVTVEWSAPAQKVTVSGTAVLLESSQGQCKAPDQAVQGMAMVSGAQTKVKAT